MEEKLSCWLEKLTPEMVQKAQEELGETEEVRKRALRELKDLIQNEKDFHPLMDDVFLLRFLRAKKFDTKTAYANLLNYYTFKKCYSGIYTDVRPSQVKKIFDMNIAMLVPTRLTDGSATGIVRIGHFDPGSATKEELVAALLICVEYGLMSEVTQVCGGSLIIDMANFNWRLLQTFASPSFLYHGIKLLQDCIPVRLKGLHVINKPAYVSVIFNILKNFLTKKMRSRIFLHGADLQSLHKLYPPDMLPEELGGFLGPIDSSEAWDRILSREAHFERAIRHGFRSETDKRTDAQQMTVC